MKGRIFHWFILSVLAPLTVQAQNILICKDSLGRTHTSDRPIPECADRAVREMDKGGYVRREIPAPLTAEQKQQKQIEEDRRKAETAAAEEQRQNDRAMLARYRHEKDIEVARQRTLEPVAERLRREAAALALSEKDQKAAQAEHAADKKKSSPAVQRKLSEANMAVETSRSRIRDYEAEVSQINSRFAATLTRYRELTATTASSAPAAAK